MDESKNSIIWPVRGAPHFDFLKEFGFCPNQGGEGDSFVIPTDYLEEKKILEGPRMQKKTLNKNWRWGARWWVGERSDETFSHAEIRNKKRIHLHRCSDAAKNVLGRNVSSVCVYKQISYCLK